MKDLCCAVCTARFHIYSEPMEGWKERGGWWGKYLKSTGLKTQTHSHSSSNQEKKPEKAENLREVETGFLPLGSRNGGELSSNWLWEEGWKAQCRSPVYPDTWAKKMSMAVEGRRGSRTKSWQMVGPRVHQRLSTCLQLCGGTPRLLWCRYPEATQTCVAP